VAGFAVRSERAAHRAATTATHLRDAAAASSAASVFRLVFDPTRSIRCGKRRAYRSVRKYARQKSRVGLAGDSLVSERSDSYRSKPERRKMPGQPRHV